jgi:hypothetical protein
MPTLPSALVKVFDAVVTGAARTELVAVLAVVTTGARTDDEVLVRLAAAVDTVGATLDPAAATVDTAPVVTV